MHLNESMTRVVEYFFNQLASKFLCARLDFMPKILKTMASIVVGLIIFALTLEASSWLLLNSGHLSFRSDTYPIHSIKNWEQVGKEIQAFRERHPEITTKAQIDHDLTNEAPSYPLIGEKTGRYLKERGRYASNLEDTFILRGKETGRPKYKVKYTIDAFGRRKTFFTPEKNFKANLLFMGCSFTFGEGTETELIFPSLLAKEHPQLKVTNMGMAGTSVSVELMSIYFKWEKFLQGIDRTVPTYVIHTFIDDHIQRIVGTSTILARSKWHFKDPYFYLSNDKLKFGGLFETDFWNFRWLFMKYGQTNFARASLLGLPTINDNHLKLTAKIYRQLKDEMQESFPELRDFIVAIYPGNNFYSKDLMKFLSAEGITVLDYSEFDIYTLLNSHHRHLGDAHPSPLAHEFYAELLKNDLRRLYPADFSCGKDVQCGSSAPDKAARLIKSGQFYGEK